MSYNRLEDIDPLSYDEMVESLYNLDEHELRRLAYEALLISDGPDRWIGGGESGTEYKPELDAEAHCALRILDLRFKDLQYNADYNKWQPKEVKP